MTAQTIAISSNELEALHGAGPLAVSVYLHMRTWMDYSTGTTGRSRPVSLAMLASYTETHITRGAGVQIAQESEKAIRVALAKLAKAGLLRRLTGERLVFSLPLALTASARPKQTGRDEGTDSYTAPGTAKPAQELGRQAKPGTGNEGADGANRAHIMYSCTSKPHPPPVDNCRPAAGSRPARKPGLAAKAGAASTDTASTDRLMALGVKVGKPPRPGESWQEYRTRLLQTRPPEPCIWD